jgi:octaprenyl-diphosphate synthase
MNGAKSSQTAASAPEIFALVEQDLRAVERELARESVASVESVTRIARYLQTSGGKRLRPSLLLLCARVAGDGEAPSQAAIELAAVVELLHAATLVHDDVIDVAETRRGRPSTNVQWGNHTSVLAGDWLYMQAFQVALQLRNFHVLDLLIGLTQLMVEGELIQLERLGKIDITEADCMELADRKTAGLFSVCAKLGAIVAGAENGLEEKLGEFAWNLGMAFQLIDDVLDFNAEERVLGKPVGGDLREGKVTLPVVYALESAAAEERRQVEVVLRDRAYGRVKLADIRAIVEDRGGIRRALDRAQQFSERAAQIAAELPESAFQRGLIALAELVVERSF